MDVWGILTGIRGNLTAYNAVIADMKGYEVNKVFILGDVIAPDIDNQRVVEDLQKTVLGFAPQICLGWWEQQCLILAGLTEEREAEGLLQRYGAGTAKALWDSIPRSVLDWIYNLRFAFIEYDCILLHGSTLSVSESLTPKTSPFVLYDRVVRSGCNYLFCARSGSIFRYQVQTGLIHSEVEALGDQKMSSITKAKEKYIIGVGNVGDSPGIATYVIYAPESDRLIMREVRY